MDVRQSQTIMTAEVVDSGSAHDEQGQTGYVGPAVMQIEQLLGKLDHLNSEWL
jgi:hypothetical protein